MVTIKLDSQGETKQLPENSEFKEKFKPLASGILISKSDQDPFNGTIQVNYDNGEKYALYNYVDGKQEGKQITYHPNGNVKNEIQLKHGAYNGEFKQYYENGHLQSMAIFKSGKQTALTSYFDSGLKNVIVIYDDNGTKKEENIFNESGKIISNKTYGTNIDAKYYYDNGSVESEGKEKKEGFPPSLFKKIDEWKYYYPSGKVKEEGSWTMGGRHGNDNVQVGIWKYYDDEGTLVETIEYDGMGMQIEKN